MANRYPLIVNPSTNQIQEIPFGDVLNLDGNTVNQLNVSGVTTSAGGFEGNLTGTASTAIDVIGGIGSITSLSVSGVSTLGTVEILSGIVTASSGIVTYYGDGSKLQNIISGVGIQSTGTVVGTGITTLNFIGAGNTFAVNGSTIDISIQGSGGESYWAPSTLGIHTTSNVGIGTTDPNTKLHVVGDINLDDGGSYTTTVQCVTPTADRTISFPDATGTVALVSGSSGQLIYNLAGAYSGVLNSGVDTSGNITLGGRFISSLNGAASAPPVTLTGTWFTGGTSTTTKPHVLIEPTGTTSTAWSTSGTGLGVNAPSGFVGNLLDLQVNGTSRFRVTNFSATLVTNNANTGGTDGLFFTNATLTERHGIGTRYTGATGDIVLWGYGNALACAGFWGFFVNEKIGFTSGSVVTGSPDTYITRLSSGSLQLSSTIQLGTGGFAVGEAANTLAQRNGTNAQTLRCYNTYTSATSFERAKIEWSSNVLRIGTEKGASGGTARDMVFETDGTERARIAADGSINIVSTDPTGVTGATQITNIISLTQAAYDAIVSPSATTLYVITD